MTIFDFKITNNIANWYIINDAVMGGKSNGNFILDSNRHGLFEGDVSLKNNGGFSMVQYPFKQKKVNTFTKVKMRLKGDGKTYQFRIKTNTDDSYSYVASFDTSGAWETITISFNTMYPAFRGKKLNTTNYPGEQMEMIAFLIGNKKAENFKLLIDRIVLE